MKLDREERHREQVAALFAARREEIEGLVPGAEVRHIGATSVPGSVTKGDLDILVSVDAGSVEEVAAVLERRYAVNQPEIWSPTFASFAEMPSGPVAVGVQLVARGSEDERMFIAWREMLSADPDLLAEYNALKRRHADRASERYRAAKGEFIEARLGASATAEDCRGR